MIARSVAALCVAALLATGAGAAAGTVAGTVVVNPLAVALTIAPAQVGLGGSATATATVTNAGVAALTAVAVTLRVDPLGLAIGGASRAITLSPGSAPVSWPVCGLVSGTYLLLASAEAGAFAAESSARLLSVSSALVSTCPEDVAIQAAAGATVTSDAEADGATLADPLETWLTTAVPGSVSIAERPISALAPTAFVFVSQLAEISAPPGSLSLAFRLDASIVRSGGPLQAFRDGVLVAGCPGDPCIASRTIRADGDVELAVRTSRAGAWTFGTPITSRGLVGGVLRPATGGAALVGAASAGSAVDGVLDYGRGSTSFSSRNAVALSIAANGRSAWLAGTAADGRTYLAQLEDNGRDGRGDRFRLWIGGILQTGDGKLAAGDVRIVR